MRVMFVLGAAGIAAGCLGCNDRALIDLLFDNGGAHAAGSSPAPAPDGGAGRGGGDGGIVAACGPLTFSSSMTPAPAAAGQGYTRCGSLGPETGWQVTLAPAADHLAARTAAGTVRLLAAAPWHELAQLASPLGQLDAVAFSPDGATLATLSAEMGEVALWRAADGRLSRAIAGPAASGVDTTAAALAYTSDGARLATSLGTIIDLAAGTMTSWLTGQPVAFTLTENPQNLGVSSAAGGGVPVLRFTAGDARLFVETDFQIGDSPPSTRLELRDPDTASQVILYSFYTRGLLGYALSGDGRLIATGTTAEAASVAGAPLGLTIFDAATGATLAADTSFTGSVIGFAPDGTRLFTQDGQVIRARATSDLRVLDAFSLPDGTTVLGVSPGADLVGATASATSWFDPGSGRVVLTAPYRLAAVTWSADGRYGAGSGDPAALFHFWHEADDAQLCEPPPAGDPAPPLDALGTLGPTTEGQSVASADGSVRVTDAFVVHAHATNYDALGVTDSASGTLLRQFGATSGALPIALSTPGGARLFTPTGADIAIWCR